MSVKIIIDSTVDLPQAVKARCGVAPLSVLFGEESYLDGVTINHKEFYDKLVSCEQLPTTSQPTPDSFAKLYKQAVAAGQQVVVVTISCPAPTRAPPSPPWTTRTKCSSWTA